MLEERLAGESRRHPRAVGLEERYAGLLPEVLIGIGLDAFAGLAAKALEPKPEQELSLQHIHAPAVSVREQAELVVDRLRRSGTMTFRALCGDSPDMMTTVARFLALLELFRESAVAFDQVSPLGELTVRWTGGVDPDVGVRPPDRRVRGRPRATSRGTARAGGRHDDPPRGGRMTEDVLEVAVAELRPSLEALLMIADQPLDETTLATAVGRTRSRTCRWRSAALAAGVRRPGARLRAAQRRGWLAATTPARSSRRSSRRSSSTGSRRG